MGMLRTHVHLLRLIAALIVCAGILWVMARWMAVTAMGTPPPPERGPFSVHGIRYGMSKDEAKLCRGVPMQFRVRAARVAPQAPCTVLLSKSDEVINVNGRCLEVNGRCVVRAGDLLGKVAQVLGRPDEDDHEGSMGTHGAWIYHRLHVEVDYDGDVVERLQVGEQLAIR